MSNEDPSVVELQNRVDALARRNEAMRDTIETMQSAMEARDERIESLEYELERFRERTELLDSVISGEADAKEKRMGRLVQTLYQDAAPAGSASMTARDGHENLNRSIDRTTVYDLFEDIVEYIGDTDLCYLKRESRASKRNTRLILDLSRGEPPAEIGGVRVAGVSD